MIPTEIVKGKLWSGPVQSIMPENLRRVLDQGVVCIVSVLPIGQVGFPVDRIEPRPKAHHVLVAWDDDELDPQRIDYAIHLNVPTLIHCNAGENRSTTLAACWLLKHISGHSWASALELVMQAREQELGRPPRVHDQMRQNVERYAAWLEPIQLTSPTGRMHNSEPRLQNIPPPKTELGTQIKDALRKPPK
jgi:hypothetical protein